ncbi:VanZ family protein [Cognatitamlana onchidii]|uniref:VanZ family protein n=1 Tax=Cognatitamlana onchidii TaxID=2562860 RepID=UPI0014560CC2|nr:VanZ family protein [Algibacter onchidii]
MLKNLVAVAAFGYTIALSTVSLIRLNNLPDVGISFADKIFHLLAYALLTILWYGMFLLTFKIKKRRAMLIAVLFAVIFGIVIEVIQETMTVSRGLDIYDMVANTLGAVLASLILLFKNSLRVKNS